MSGRVDPTFGGSFAGSKVLVTGHTGFKGGWLSAWLLKLGAKVSGLSLPPEPGQGFFCSTDIESRITNRYADIGDAAALEDALKGVDAEILFHLAAQPLVRSSYRNPAETFRTNVSGTAHVLDMARKMPSLRAIVVITSDKCYDNKEWSWGYRENDPLGGRDPYSASKGCTELVAHSYRHAFFDDPDGAQLATARAGNVFGGGDWGEERLVPDIVRAGASGIPVPIRNPEAVRPWQHVLEPLSGYLALAAALLDHGKQYAGAWNFGPDLAGSINVRDLVTMILASWGGNAPSIAFPAGARTLDFNMHEAGILRLDSTKAQTQLGWRPQLDLPTAIAMTIDWYRAHARRADMSELSAQQIRFYSERMASDVIGSSAFVVE
ncbi:CDP-glucose 4,6-dehydratase [Aliiruegeria lutimaris]|uniref:CDP-glucose 4,6-dehydratase n=1 Tax=Aliiruegeria lutimaris TaxID=571298 RepID=A0A1G9FTA7_9RHOB|nr:CDP-glucose 4,6-dehydratase [Aliiruegeria lutimaris]SDK91373.1 CDP-glucose 4,6-dehydratase [Aliiruegeria lutimaris]